MKENREYLCGVRILLNEILYDVDFVSWKIANCRIEDAQQRAEAQTDAESKEWIIRQIECAIGEITKCIEAYVIGRSRFVSNELKEQPEWNINLHMEEGWNGSPERLSKLIHNAIVSHVLAKWFILVKADEAPTWEADYQQHLQKIAAEARSTKGINVLFRL